MSYVKIGCICVLLSDVSMHYVRERVEPIVVEADGVFAEMGVVIVRTVEDACAASDEIFVQSWFGDAGRVVVVKEFMHGE